MRPADSTLKTIPDGKAAAKLKKVRESVRQRLLKRVDPSALERDLLVFLRKLGDPLPVKLLLARRLAEYFITTWPLVDARDLERIIERVPKTLDDALFDIAVEDINFFYTDVISKEPPSKRKRKKPADEQERRRNIAQSKRRYDEKRVYRPTGVGVIEREFSERSVGAILSGEPPTGNCLDELLLGGEVEMLDGVHCVEALFGIDRHKLPKSLPRVRRGRKIFYNLVYVLQCMKVLMNEGRWPAQRDRRDLVLTGIITRAHNLGRAELAGKLKEIFHPYLN